MDTNEHQHEGSTGSISWATVLLVALIGGITLASLIDVSTTKVNNRGARRLLSHQIKLVEAKPRHLVAAIAILEDSRRNLEITRDLLIPEQYRASISKYAYSKNIRSQLEQVELDLELLGY